MHRLGWVFLVALLVAMPIVSADAGQFGDGTLDFGITDQGGGGPVAPSGLVMQAERAGSGGGGPVVVVDSVTWGADEPAAEPIEVTEQTVDLHLRFLARTGVQPVTVCLGVVDASGFTSLSCSTHAGGPTLSEVREFSFEVPSHTWAPGEAPAIRLSVDALGAGTGVAIVEPGPSAALHFTECPPSESYPASGSCPEGA